MKVYIWSSPKNPTIVVIARSLRQARRAIRAEADQHPKLDAAIVKRTKPTIAQRIYADRSLFFYTHTEEP